MSGIKGKNTRPELIVRKILHRSGFRFRLHRKDLPGKPDIILPKYRTVIFVNGCFWHGHENCHLFRMPKSRQEFWEKKICGNVARDTKNRLLLSELGWGVLTIWECSLKGKMKLDIADVEAQLKQHLLSSENNTKECIIRG